MTATQIVQPHSRGVAGVLTDAGLREDVAVHAAGNAVNVYYRDRLVTERVESRRLDRIVRLLTKAGYEAHRSVPVPWLVRVTGKRKNIRV